MEPPDRPQGAEHQHAVCSLESIRKSVLFHNVNKEIMFTIEGKDARKAL